MKERRYDIDWLRIIAMLAVFLFHCTRFFDPEGWHLKNTEQSDIIFISMRGCDDTGLFLSAGAVPYILPG